MSPPLLGVREEGESNVTLLTSSASMGSICQNISELKECNYMGLSDCSSIDSSTFSTTSEDYTCSLNLKATELRLGLPGSQFPEGDPEHCLLSSTNLDEKPLFPLHPSKDNNFSLSQKTIVSGSKRGFSDAMDGLSQGKFAAGSEVNAVLSAGATPNLAVKSVIAKDHPASQSIKMQEAGVKQTTHKSPTSAANNNNCAPATKAQVVGWPPIRSYRKNTLVTTLKNTDEVQGKVGSCPLFVKVSMDGAPYLRKVDLKTCSAYQELSSTLEKMFSCFTIGQCESHGALGREMLNESKLKDLLHGSEYVLTYEDKDGDWMLVGDVPWAMFIDTCKRLRIMKSSDAIGLAPRAMEKSQNRN